MKLNYPVAKYIRKSQNFIFDIDGTLRGKYLDTQTNKTLLKLLKKVALHNNMYITTGRTYQHVLNFLSELDTKNTPQRTRKLFSLIFYEGGHLCHNGIRSFSLIKKKSKNQLYQLKQFINSRFAKYGNKWHIKNSNFALVSKPKPHLIGKCVVVLEEVKKSKEDGKLLEYLSEYLRINKLNLLESVEAGDAIIIKVKDVTKKKSAKIYKINLHNSIFFCDEDNDLEFAREILKNGGQVICPRNAILKLREIATYIAENTYGKGVVEYLESYLSIFYKQ